MLVVAGFKWDRFAFEAVAYALLLAVVAPEFDYLLFLALFAFGVPILRAC